MTDHSRYKSPSGAQLTLRRRTGDSLDLDERLFLMVDGRGMFIPTAELLAMIDAADPDAMRAYLRETAPEVIADVYRPAPAAADHFDYLDTETPEADSPEDVDDRPDSLPRRFGRAEAMLAAGNHLIAQASEVLDSIDTELSR